MATHQATFQSLRDQMTLLQQKIEHDNSLLFKTSSNTAPTGATASNSHLPVPPSTNSPASSYSSSATTGVKDYASLALEWQLINQNLSFTRQGLKVRIYLVLRRA